MAALGLGSYGSDASSDDEADQAEPYPLTQPLALEEAEESEEEQEESLIDASLSPCLPEGVFSNPPRPILVRSPTTV